MKNFWRITLIILASVAVGAGVSSAMYGYIGSKVNRGSSFAAIGQAGESGDYGFKNVALAGMDARPVGAAPDLVPAAESSVHAVVHIKVQGAEVLKEDRW